ncbi:MAG: acyltransferase [Spirochaetales bacterium]|nr:acyltransferase [Spirochaetales bacterium]
MIRKFFWSIVLKSGKGLGVFNKFFTVTSGEYAEYLKKRNVLYAMGSECYINYDVTITDPRYVKLGSNVCLASCSLIGHDASISVFSRSRGIILDKVGKIEIGDNCFVGHGAIILPDVKIGKDCIVAAGAVVTKSFPDNSIIGGTPGRIIGWTDEFIARQLSQTRNYPWYDILQKRQGSYDPEYESILLEMRVKYFYETPVDPLENEISAADFSEKVNP